MLQIRSVSSAPEDYEESMLPKDEDAMTVKGSVTVPWRRMQGKLKRPQNLALVNQLKVDSGWASAHRRRNQLEDILPSESSMTVCSLLQGFIDTYIRRNPTLVRQRHNGKDNSNVKFQVRILSHSSEWKYTACRHDEDHKFRY
jgi:hypothetical protein